MKSAHQVNVLNPSILEGLSLNELSSKEALKITGGGESSRMKENCIGLLVIATCALLGGLYMHMKYQSINIDPDVLHSIVTVRIQELQSRQNLDNDLNISTNSISTDAGSISEYEEAFKNQEINFFKSSKRKKIIRGAINGASAGVLILYAKLAYISSKNIYWH